MCSACVCSLASHHFLVGLSNSVKVEADESRDSDANDTANNEFGFFGENLDNTRDESEENSNLHPLGNIDSVVLTIFLEPFKPLQSYEKAWD